MKFFSTCNHYECRLMGANYTESERVLECAISIPLEGGVEGNGMGYISVGCRICLKLS